MMNFGLVLRNTGAASGPEMIEAGAETAERLGITGWVRNLPAGVPNHRPDHDPHEDVGHRNGRSAPLGQFD